MSYRHLSGLLSFYGEDGFTAAIGLLAVDGLMVMATGALIATRRAEPTVSPAIKADTAPAVEADTNPDTTTDKASGNAPVPQPARRRTRKPDTAAAVAQLRARHPELPADIAKRLKVSDRTVRRHLAARITDQPEPSPLTAA